MLKSVIKRVPVYPAVSLRFGTIIGQIFNHIFNVGTFCKANSNNAVSRNSCAFIYFNPFVKMKQENVFFFFLFLVAK